MPDQDVPDQDKPQLDEVDNDIELEEDALDGFRDVPVGTGDPNIVGDAGPLDTPPGHDPENDDL